MDTREEARQHQRLRGRQKGGFTGNEQTERQKENQDVCYQETNGVRHPNASGCRMVHGLKTERNKKGQSGGGGRGGSDMPSEDKS